MVRADVCDLIAEDPGAHGIFEPPEEITRRVYCNVRSVGRSEVYQAQAAGLNPELKLILAHAFEYHGEKLVDFRDERWRVLRSYVNEGDQIELTLQRVTGNAVEVSPGV